MKPDERNLPLSTDSTEAARLFDRAVEHYLKYHTDTMALVGKAIAADADFVMAHCLKGYLLLGAANPAHRQQIASTLATAQSAAATATQREKQHVAAFAAWADGELDKSFAIWRQILDATPTDLLALRICDTTWFRHGQTQKNSRAGRPHRATLVIRSARLRHAAMRLGLRARGDRRLRRGRTRSGCRTGTGPHELLRAPRQDARAGDGLPPA